MVEQFVDLPKIPKGWQKHYEYYIRYNEEANKPILILHLPPDLDLEKLEIDIDVEKQEIYIGVEGIPPFVCGSLAHKISDFEKVLEERKLMITFTPEEQIKWEILITGSNSSHGLCDPFSAYLLYAITKDQINDMNVQLLHMSAVMGFIPAIISFYTVLIKFYLPIEQADKFMYTMNEIYDDPLIYLKMGIVHFTRDTEEDFKLAFNLLEKAQDLPEAQVFLGMYYDPYYYVPFGNKNGQMAVHFYKKALVFNTNDYRAHLQLANLLYNGVGVEKDIEAAEMHYNIAKKGFPNAEPLGSASNVQYITSSQTQYPSLVKIGAFTSAAALTGAGLYVLYRFIMKKRM